VKKLALLRAFLEPKYPHKFDAWVEDMTLKVRGAHEGNRILLHTMTYRAVFSMEGYPYLKSPISLFNARLLTWLADHDDRSELDDRDPDITFDLLDNETANVELTLQFEEKVYIKQSETGLIEYGGKTWTLDEPEYDIAETIEAIEVNING